MYSYILSIILAISAILIIPRENQEDSSCQPETSSATPRSKHVLSKFSELQTEPQAESPGTQRKYYEGIDIALRKSKGKTRKNKSKTRNNKSKKRTKRNKSKKR